MACFVSLCCLAAVISSPAQTFTSLLSFNYTDGANPEGTLVQGLDGNFYGTTAGGSDTKCPNGCGTIFKITAGGKLVTMHSFLGTDGWLPAAGLLQATNGTFYGTTVYGGDLNCHPPYGCGTIFQITPAGKLTTLHIFTGADGKWPWGGLIQATDGNFYGTTSSGGSGTCVDGCGTVFRISPRGTLTTLHNFDGTDGWGPTARLLQASSGNFYGTTSIGGDLNCQPNFGCGTIFEMSPQGTLRNFYTFCATSGTVDCRTDGAFPGVALLQNSDGNFHGTTDGGGTGAYSWGTVYEITAQGTVTALHSFCQLPECADGLSPQGDLVQAADGNFYDVTGGGGIYGSGTLFEITPGGALTTLHTFDGADGSSPSAGMVQATNGIFYGTTFTSGASTNCGGGGCGTVFSLSMGFGPFVTTLPASGNVGTKVKILGTDLTGTTSVTFNGTAAVFTAVSATQITTTVPTGATTGTVLVTTPSGKLDSNVAFTVR